MAKVWFITGANRGLGRAFSEAALERGDKVAVTSRRLAALADLSEKYCESVLALELDTTDRARVHAAVDDTAKRFGRIDVVVNNAGYGAFGAIEELSEKQLRDQIEVNLFGVFHVTQAVLPIMRAQRSGHIIQVSSVSGVAAFPYQGAYVASKWAVEGMTDVLAQEVQGFGIKVTLLEPGPFATDLHGDSSSNAEPKPQYDGLRAGMAELGKTIVAVSGNPRAAGDALLEVVDAQDPPLRIFLGKSGLAWVPTVYAERVKTWEKWRGVSTAEGLGEAFPGP